MLLRSSDGTERSTIKSDPTAVQRYAFAIGMVLLGALAREALTPAVGPTALPYIFFFPAIAAAAWYGGLRPAILATGLASAAAALLFLHDAATPPVLTFADVASIGAFIFGCAVIIGAIQKMHTANDRLRHEMTLREQTEIERVQTQHLLATTLASIGDGVIVTDAAGRITFLNTEAERLTGWQSDEASGKALSTVFKIVSELDRASVEDPVAKVLRVGTTAALANHTLLIAKDGSEIAIDDSAAPIRTDPKTISGVVLVFRDVSEQRKAEHARSRLAAIVQFSGDAIITKDLQGVVQTWNSSAERLFGYKPEEIIGKSITMLIPGERLNEETEILERLRSGLAYERLQTIRISKDGRHIPVSLSVSPLKDKDDNVIGASKIVHDISDIVAAREALEQEREILATTLSSIGDAVIVTDAMGNVTFLNPEAERLTGWKQAEAIGTPLPSIFRILNEETREALENPVDKVLRLGSAVALTNHTVLLARDGSEMPIDDSAAPIIHAGGTLFGVVLVFRDFTARRQAEQKLRDSEEATREASRRKDEFLAILSHELRNPLAPIRMAATMLKKVEPAQPELRELRETIDRQARQLTRLLDDLLDVSRITSGKIALLKDSVDLKLALSSAVESVDTQLKARKHQLLLQLPEYPIPVEGDLVRLAQVFANLLSNAIKYTPEGGRITLEAGEEDKQAYVRIRDTGIGIMAEHISRIFEMFAQVDQSLERGLGGLGVGLTLARRLVELHGGSIEAESEGLNRGSQFTVRLPLATAESKPAPILDGITAANSTDRPRRRVLVADDNVDSAAMLTAVLELAGHDVLTTHDGAAALEAASSFKPDVAILDIGMPRLNGYDVAREMRARLGDRLLLIAMTGWGQAEDKRLAAAAGFNHHLTKPVEISSLYKLLQ